MKGRGGSNGLLGSRADLERPDPFRLWARRTQASRPFATRLARTSWKDERTTARPWPTILGKALPVRPPSHCPATRMRECGTSLGQLACFAADLLESALLESAVASPPQWRDVTD
jgi:hypothetical protein